MNELPSGWRPTTVGEVTSRPATVDWDDWHSATFKYIDIGSIKSQGAQIVSPKTLETRAAPSRAKQIVRAGDTVFSTVRTYLRNIGYVDQQLDGQIASTGFCVLRPLEGVWPRYVYYYVQSPSFIRDISAQQRGVSYPAVTDGQARSMTMPLPPSREQERIVAAIEEQFSRLDAGVAALDRVKQNVNRMRAAILQAAVTGALVPTETVDEPVQYLLDRIEEERRQHLTLHPFPGSKRAPAEPDAVSLPGLPPGWAWATVDQLCTRVVDGVHKKPNYVGEGVPFVTVRNLTAGSGISFDHLNYVRPEDHALFIRRAHPEKGDLLLSKDGTLGVVRSIRDDREFSIFVSVALLKPVDRRMTDYLEVALQSPIVQRQMVPKGSGLQHIHLEDLRQDSIPIPPLQQQRMIVAEVRRQMSLLDQIEKTLMTLSTRSRAFRSSILAAAFSGKLVHQDPTDEPASILLERITAERVASTGHKASRNTRQERLPV